MPSPLQITNAMAPATLVPDELEDPNNPKTQTGPIPTIAQAPGIAPPEETTIPTPTTYTPEQLQVDPASTVEGRIGSIIDKGGVLQQSAKTLAAQQQQQKGLLNTSMAVGAAQKAVIDSAMPIATEDARMSFAAQQANQAASNRALESQALFGQQSELQAQKALIDEKLLTASADEQMRLIAQRGELDTQLQNLRGEQAIAQIGEQGVIEERLVNRRGEIDKELQTADAETRSRLLAEQGIIDFDLVKAQGDEQRLLQSEAAGIAQELETLRASFRTEDLAAQRLHENQLTTMQADINTKLQELRGRQEEGLLELQGAQAESLANVRGEFDTLLATQQSATMLYANHIQAINEILANPDIPSASKDSLIQYQIDTVTASLSMISAMGDVDFGDLISNTSTDTYDQYTPPKGSTPPLQVAPVPDFAPNTTNPGPSKNAGEQL